jgi:uncharacterized OB-fold protein
MTAMTLKGFFERAAAGEITAIRCVRCTALSIPPREFCPSCGARDWQTAPLSGAGTVASYTIIRVAPKRFAGEAPYAIAQVRLAEGVSVLARIVDVPLDALSIGTPVRFRPVPRLAEAGAAEPGTALAFGPA